jgi:HD-GYP domain-containing protein (c-di-GMP phosphodiesterase class II)
MSHEFTGVTRFSGLCERILAALRRELFMSRAAIFLPRRGGKGLLELQAASGFAAGRLDRLGLSIFHGLGQSFVRSREVQSLSAISAQGAAAREQSMLSEVGLRWGVSIRTEDREIAILFFGGSDEEIELPPWKTQVLHALLGSATVAIINLEQVQVLKDRWMGSVRGLVAAAELRCPEDRGHAERVALGALRLGRAVGLGPEELENLVISALLHDVGKIGLLPQGSMPSKSHPILGSQILSRAKPPPAVVQGVEQHHERYDGHGVPYGLRREEIHLFGRILAIVNAYDRMRCSAANPLPAEESLRRLELGAGLLFDPGLVAQFAGEVGRSPNAAFDPSEESWLNEFFDGC